MTSDASKIQAVFFSRRPEHAVTDTPIMVPTRLRRYGLSEIINHLLGLETPVPFDFIIDGRFLKSSLQQFIDANSLSMESILRIEFVEGSIPPKSTAVLQQDDWVSSISILKSSPFILTGSYDCHARVWSMSGQCIQTLAAHTAAVKCVAWAPLETGFLALSASQDQTIAAHHISQNGKQSELAYSCLEHQGSVESLAVNKDASYFASASWDQTIRIWTTSPNDAQAQEAERTSSSKRQKLTDKKVVKTAEATLEGHVGAVTCVAYGADEATVYSGGMDHSVRVWDIPSLSTVSLMNCEKSVTSLAFCDETGLIVTGHSDNAARLWDPRSKDGIVVKMKFDSHTNWVSAVTWSPHSSLSFATASYDGQVKVWDVRSSVPQYTLSGSDDKENCKIFGLDWHKDLLCCGGQDARMHCFTAK